MADNELFIDDQHPVSGRFAILEDDGTSAWLYLSNPSELKPVADIWVFNRVDAPPYATIQQYRGGPPPAAIGYASESARLDNPLDFSWTFLWSADGESVAVLKDDEPVAFLVTGEKHGYSRELIKSGPWGQTWSDERFRDTF